MIRTRTTRWLSVAFVLQAVACSSDDNTGPETAGPGGAAGGADGQSMGPGGQLLPPGAGGGTTDPGMPPAPPPPGKYTLETTAGTTAGRRLTRDEFINSVSDLFGTAGSAEERIGNESAAALRFRNDLRELGVDDARINSYETVAGDVGAAVTPEVLAKYGACPDNGAACRQTFVAELGRHVYRRPLTDAELANLVRLFDVVPAGADAFVKGARLVVSAMLQAPQFLYKLERVQARPDNYEIATRLSFLLWKSGPDTALLDAAVRGELSTAQGVDAAAQLMLQSPKAKRGVRAFTDDWLRLYNNLKRAPVANVGLTETALVAMREETLRFVERVLMDEQAVVTSVLSNRVAEFAPDLAPIYGVTPSADNRYDFAADPNRTGLLTQAAVLGNRAGPLRASIVDRGLTIVEEFLCIEIPPPTPDGLAAVALFEEAAKTASEREALIKLTTPAQCQACHSNIDPLGFPFENFDVAGAYKQVDEKGNMLKGDGQLNIDGQLQPYANVGEFSTILANSPTVHRCITEKYLQYALGRRLTDRDRLLHEHAYTDAQAKGGKYSAWVTAVVSSDAFRNPAPEVEAL